MTYPLLSLYPRSGYIMCLLRTCEWLFRITFGTFFGTNCTPKRRELYRFVLSIMGKISLYCSSIVSRYEFAPCSFSRYILR